MGEQHIFLLIKSLLFDLCYYNQTNTLNSPHGVDVCGGRNEPNLYGDRAETALSGKKGD